MTNWDDFRYLVAVEDCGSFAGAARRLGVSQPTVSRRVVELEKRLATALFERTPDGTRLSGIGMRVCEEARALALQAERVEMCARSAATGLARVRISASEGVSFAILTPLLARFRRERPDIATDLIIGNRPVDIRRGEAEIALRIGDPADESLLGRRLGGAHFGLYGHESYLARQGEPQCPADLAGHDVIESTGEIADLPQAHWLRSHAEEAVAAISANSILNQMKALICGAGLLTLPNYLAVDLNGVRRVLAAVFDPEIDVWLLSERLVAARPEVRATIDFLSAETPGLLRRMADQR